MCSVHCDVSGRARLAALAALGGVVVAGCASGPTGGGTTSGSAAPVIVNHQEVVQAQRREYRTTGMMEQGVADTTVVQVLVDALGRVEDVRVAVGSEDETVDQAALRVARVHRFEPARNRGKAVAVWVSLSISFEPRLCDFPPNAAGIWMMERLDAGDRRGETTVALLVDERGSVRQVKIETGSGWDRFDQAALGAARKTRFRPGWVKCEPAEMWTTVKYGFGNSFTLARSGGVDLERGGTVGGSGGILARAARVGRAGQGEEEDRRKEHGGGGDGVCGSATHRVSVPANGSTT